MDLYLPTWFRNDPSLRAAALFKIVKFCFRQRIHFVHGSLFHPSMSDTRV